MRTFCLFLCAVSLAGCGPRDTRPGQIKLKEICAQRGFAYHVYCYKGNGCNAEVWNSAISHLQANRVGKWIGHADTPDDAADDVIGMLGDTKNQIHYDMPSTYDSGDITP